MAKNGQKQPKMAKNGQKWPKMTQKKIDKNIFESFQVYDRLDELGADTAEAKASHILKGLGFDKAMQAKKCKDFSGKKNHESVIFS